MSDRKSPIAEIGSGSPRRIPDTMPADTAFALNQNNLALERTEFSKIRTDLALTNSRLSVDRTHLSYLRTVVSLLGSAATLYKALPLLGASEIFSTGLAVFLFLAAAFFCYKDATTYPKMKRHLKEMEERASKLAEETENNVYQFQE